MVFNKLVSAFVHTARKARPRLRMRPGPVAPQYALHGRSAGANPSHRSQGDWPVSTRWGNYTTAVPCIDQWLMRPFASPRSLRTLS